MKSLVIKEKKSSICVVSSEREEIIAKLEVKEWETNFFKRKFGSLILNHKLLGSYNQKTNEYILDALVHYADKNQYDLIELHLDILEMNLVPVLEDKDFRLVETQISFITLMKKQDIEEYPSEVGEVCFAAPTDLEEILVLTRRAFSNNPSFLSRFKNRTYFTQEDTERYYAAWIENHLRSSDTYFAVLKRETKIIGYLIYRKTGRFRGKPIYKGILTAVDPDYQGQKAHLAMQPFVYKRLPGEQFYLNIITQLTNIAAIKNFIRSKKSLNSIGLIFYWLPK